MSNHDQDRMPPREVTGNEKKHPALSIVYRVYAQQEVFVLHDNVGDIEEYFKAFGLAEPIPELVHPNRVREEQFVDTGQITSLVNKVVETVSFDGGRSDEIDIDPRMHMSFLTALYRHVVIGDRKVYLGDSLNPEKVKQHLIAELLGLKLVW